MKGILLSILFIACVMPSFAQELPRSACPTNHFVNDYASILTKSESVFLENKLKTYNDTSAFDINIIIERSIGEKDIKQYAQEIATGWGITDRNNSLLFLLVIDKVKIDISVFNGLDTIFTNDVPKRLVENKVVKNFRSENYFDGILSGVNTLIKLLEGNSMDKRAVSNKGTDVIARVLFTIAAVILFVILPYLRYRKIKQLHIGSEKLNFWKTFFLMNALAEKEIIKSSQQGDTTKRSTFMLKNGSGGAIGRW